MKRFTVKRFTEAGRFGGGSGAKKEARIDTRGRQVGKCIAGDSVKRHERPSAGQ